MTDELVAGRELDAQVAEKVMGWEPYSGGYYYYGEAGRMLVCMEPGDGAAPHWSPSTDIAAAFQVVDAMEGRNYGMVMWRAWPLSSAMRGFQVRFFKGVQAPTHEQGGWQEAFTAPLAICRAALAATTH